MAGTRPPRHRRPRGRVGDRQLQPARRAAQPGAERLAPDRRAAEAAARSDPESGERRPRIDGFRARHAHGGDGGARQGAGGHRPGRRGARRKASSRRRSAGCFAVAENYPTLKSNDNVKMLQEELSATENKVGFARQFYNDIATKFNTAQQVFPTNLFAGDARLQAGGAVRDHRSRRPRRADRRSRPTLISRPADRVRLAPACRSRHEPLRAAGRRTAAGPGSIMVAFVAFLLAARPRLRRVLSRRRRRLRADRHAWPRSASGPSPRWPATTAATAPCWPRPARRRSPQLAARRRRGRQAEAAPARERRRRDGDRRRAAPAEGLRRARSRSERVCHGPRPEHASIAVTRGLLDALDREELQGVVAHEMSHIRNLDIRVMTLVAALVGAVALLSDWAAPRHDVGRRTRGARDDEPEGGGLVGIVFFVVWLLAIVARAHPRPGAGHDGLAAPRISGRRVGRRADAQPARPGERAREDRGRGRRRRRRSTAGRRTCASPIRSAAG